MHPDLAALLDVREDSKIGIVTALWNYIKLNNLQDKADRKIVRLDDKLKAVSSTPQFHQLLGFKRANTY